MGEWTKERDELLAEGLAAIEKMRELTGGAVTLYEFPVVEVRDLRAAWLAARDEAERFEEARQNAMNWGIEKDKDLARRVDEYSALLAQERAEVERLRSAVSEWTVETLEQRRRAEKAEAEVERLRALVDPVTLGPDTEPGRAGGDVVWEDPQVVVDRLNAANVKAERERDDALLEVERLTGLVTTATVEAAKAQKERDEARGALDALALAGEHDRARLEAALAVALSPVVNGRTLGEWRSVGVTEPWKPTRADVEAALGRADLTWVRQATCDLIEADGPDTDQAKEDRLIVELVCAVLGVS